MLIVPTQSATPMPRQINRRIYFHTIIAASKALQFTVAMRARSGSDRGRLHCVFHFTVETQPVVIWFNLKGAFPELTGARLYSAHDGSLDHLVRGSRGSLADTLLAVAPKTGERR